MAYLNKIDVAEYIMGKHFKEYGYEISPLKLQKSLYLLLAMWGGNALVINQDIKNDNYVEYEKMFDLHLFNSGFEAWKYGPVDREIYQKFKCNELQSVDKLEFTNKEVESIIQPFIDSMLEQIFKVNDFDLVEITHRDLAWQNAFDGNGNTKINVQEIIEEYGERLSE